jgi:hypothetical protein
MAETLEQVWASSLDASSIPPELNDQFVCGLELEVEDVREFNDLDLLNVNSVEDGSLRNSGREFLLPPDTLEGQMHRLRTLYNPKNRFIIRGPDAYSTRTSVHVHVNCRCLSRTSVRSIVLLYSIFEPVFFRFAGSARANNIHCVPLHWTHLSNYYGGALELLIKKWSKYTALNLKPLSKLGTLEFRHLYGTDDQQVIETWLRMIRVIWEAGRNLQIKRQLVLGTMTKLKEIEQQLITDGVHKYAKEPIDFRLEDNLLDFKLQFLP